MPIETLEKIEIASDRVSDYQKKYNVNQKKIAYLIGKNLTLFLCLLVPLLLISFVWTEFAAIVFSTKMIADGVLTVALFIVGETLMTKLGSDGGRMDSSYVSSKLDFESTVNKVNDVGSMLLGIFCDWQIDLELEQAIRFRLKMLRMTPKMWDEVKNLRPEELESRFGKKKAKKMLEIINLKPIELNEAILLYDGEYTARGGVPKSGEEYIREKKHVISVILGCIFTGLLTVTVVFTLTSDISLARVIYTVFKLTMLLFRMWRGYSRGAKAFNTVEVKQLKAKTMYLKQYVKFIEGKIYLKLGDKYGDISQFVGTECYNEYEKKESV